MLIMTFKLFICIKSELVLIKLFINTLESFSNFVIRSKDLNTNQGFRNVLDCKSVWPFFPHSLFMDINVNIRYPW